MNLKIVQDLNSPRINTVHFLFRNGQEATQKIYGARINCHYHAFV
jgi:hypothetical protein